MTPDGRHLRTGPPGDQEQRTSRRPRGAAATDTRRSYRSATVKSATSIPRLSFTTPTLDEAGVEDGRRDRDDEDGDRPPATEHQRQGLEQQQPDAERIAPARVRRAARDRQQRQRRQAERDRRVDEQGVRREACLDAGDHPT